MRLPHRPGLCGILQMVEKPPLCAAPFTAEAGRCGGQAAGRISTRWVSLLPVWAWGNCWVWVFEAGKHNTLNASLGSEMELHPAAPWQGAIQTWYCRCRRGAGEQRLRGKKKLNEEGNILYLNREKNDIWLCHPHHGRLGRASASSRLWELGRAGSTVGLYGLKGLLQPKRFCNSRSSGSASLGNRPGLALFSGKS